MKTRIKDWKAIQYIAELFDIYVYNGVPRSAAELSYFLTLSIFPTLICVHAMLVNFLPSVSLTSIEGINRFVPEGTYKVIMDYIEYVSSHNNSALLTAGIIGMATTSAAAFRSINNIMGDIQGKPRFMGAFGLLFSFLFSLLFLAAIYFAAIVMLAGSWLTRALGQVFPVVEALELWENLRFPLLFSIFVLIIYGLYRITAPKSVRSSFFPGAVIASALLMLISVLFSWFISMSTRYPLIYGSLASIIIFMLWIYICGQVLIMGNAFNVVHRRHLAAKATEMESKKDFESKKSLK